MNKTTNYQLNQWDADDPVIRTDFNEDNAKIDAALSEKANVSAVEALQAGKADKTALAALQTVVTGKGNCVVEYGTYVGTGVYGETDGTETVLHLGYQPKLLFVKGNGTGIFMWPSTVATNLYYSGGGCGLSVTWLEDGLQWRLSAVYQKSASEQFNAKNSTYYYVAFR